MKALTLILGGARSGKSAFAQGLASSGKRVLFVATAEALDEDMAARIREHQRSRPPAWQTLEEPRELAAALTSAVEGHDLVVIDCMTLWVSNLLLADTDKDRQIPPILETRPGSSPDQPTRELDGVLRQAEVLVGAYRQGSASWIVVSNEVGLGVVPPTPMGRRYRDALGRVNQTFAAAASQAYLMVAGLAVDLTAAGAKPWQTLIGKPPPNRPPLNRPQ